MRKREETSRTEMSTLIKQVPAMKPSKWVGWSSAGVHEYIEHKIPWRCINDINEKLDRYLPRYEALLSPLTPAENKRKAATELAARFAYMYRIQELDGILLDMPIIHTINDVIDSLRYNTTPCSLLHFKTCCIYQNLKWTKTYDVD